MENKKMSVWKQYKPFLAGLQLPLLVAVVAAVCSSIITVYGPTKIKEITNLISDGLATEIDLVAVSSIASFFSYFVCAWCHSQLYTSLYFFNEYPTFFKTLADGYR